MTEARASPTASIQPLKSKLSAFGDLRPTDLELLAQELGDVRTHAARDEVMPHDRAAVRLVCAGWVGVVRTLVDGRRPILQVVIAGDLVRAPPFSDGHVVALTDARTVDASGARKAVLKSEGSPLQSAWRLAEQDVECELFAQITRLGAMSAYERAANWIAELMRRHARAGLGDRRIPWPITQEIVADVLGLSIVHVNRVLQQMRRDGLIEFRAGMLQVCEPERLADAGLAEPD